jgi:hypothetical protein
MNFQTITQNILDWTERLDSYEKRKAIAVQRNLNELTDLVNDINSILQKHGVSSQITNKQINFDTNEIHNILLPDKTFSSIIFDTCFPKPTPKLFSHYTSFQAFSNILSSKTLRLYNLQKNHKSGEFTEFYTDHNIWGYNNKTELFGIPTDNESLMNEIFCLCLTAYGLDRHDTSKWRDFGDFGKGIRIDFEIQPYFGEFRKIYYPNTPNTGIPILKDLFETIPTKYDLPLNFTGISKIGSYYIRNEYNTENEYRFLIKRTSDEYLAKYLNPVKTDDNVAYITIALNSPFANFKIVSVQPGYDFPIEYLPDLTELIQTHSSLTNLLNKAIDYSSF